MRVMAPLKCTQVTSSDVGVSPDTARERPSSKLARKRLSFSCKLGGGDKNNFTVRIYNSAPQRLPVPQPQSVVRYSSCSSTSLWRFQ